MQHSLKAVCAYFSEEGQRKGYCVFMPILKFFSPVDLCIHVANSFSKFGVEAELLYIFI